ncbi:MAG: hypothetical protein RI952_972 [Bacteroidota bacterium]|jgi:hypothetical protein
MQETDLCILLTKPILKRNNTSKKKFNYLLNFFFDWYDIKNRRRQSHQNHLRIHR